MENEKVIREQMEETRTSLTEKLETLENKVVGTVQEATSAVSDTVENIKESVQETVATVKDSVEGTVSAVKDTVQGGVETVKDWFDIQGHVQAHPWIMFGGAVAVGYLAEQLIEKAPALPMKALSTTSSARDGERVAVVFDGKKSKAPPATSWLSDFEPEIAKLKKLAISSLLGSVRDLIVRAVPPQVGSQLQGIMDGVTTKLGGEPLPASEFKAERARASANPW